jgi:predicted DNA-binding protein
MATRKQAKKKPSRVAYEESHPTISFRLDKETHHRLKEHLKATGCSFADFVKDALGREESMVDKRVRKLASREIEQRQTPALDLELYDLVLDLANWNIILWRNLPDPLQVTCPSCLFPSRLSGKESKVVTLEMVEDGDFKCPECGLRLKNPPQLAWILLVNKVAEEVRRKKFSESQENEADEAAGKDESIS